MEGAGGRLGRSSNRFAPVASAFTGPVRRWTKRWVPLPNPSSSNPNNKSKTTTTTNNEESSHLILLKWTPTSCSSSSSSQANATDPSPKRRFRYVPVSVTGEQKLAAAENCNREAPASDGNSDADDVFMEEAQVADKEPDEEARLDLNLS